MPIGDHLLDAGLGTVSEIFEAAPPHLPCGAPSQAWSVACVLDAWTRLERLRQIPRTPTVPQVSGRVDCAPDAPPG
jgi:4-alpha-glucanotransferase